MDPVGTSSPPRQLTPQEIATCIKLFREVRHWSQDQLAAVSGLNVRTIQRVEQGEAASFDTKRALARAFDLEDIDTLNKPFSVPSAEELKVAKEKFDREHITLSLSPVTTGRQLATLAEISQLSYAEPAFELPREAAQLFAELVDYFREYGDCSELYSEVQKLDVYEDIQRDIDELKAQGVSLRFAERELHMRLGNNDKPTRLMALYVLAFPLGREPEQIATPKASKIAW